MSEAFGGDFITIVDDDGQEFELEVLDTMDYNNETYVAFLPADMDENDPAKITYPYRRLISRISSGVDRSIRSLLKKVRLKPVMTNAMMTDNLTEELTALLRALISPAPYFCPMMTANPPVSPMENPKIRKVRGPMFPTAPRASSPRPNPTIHVSAME